tara:strand:- start:478 stop:1524 length:1047 start_codon:yes stop_codon:yes gene_type:complete
MDSDFLNYRQSLSNYSGFGGQISSLKDRIYSEKTSGLESAKSALQVAGALRDSKDEETDQGLSAGGGALGAISSAYGMKKLGSKIVGKLGGKAEDAVSGLKQKASDFANKIKGQAEGKMNELKGKVQDKVNDMKGNDNTMERGDSGVENPETGATETPLPQSETTIPDTEFYAGTEPTTEPSGFGGEFDPSATSNMEMSNQANQGLEDFPSVESDGISAAEGAAEDPSVLTGTATDTGLTEAATEGADVAAEAGTDAAVAGLETAGGFLDAIPIVGDVIGAVLGIAGAVVGAVGAADAADTTQKTADLSSQESSIKTSIQNQGGFGASAIVGSVMSSTAGMPSNSGTF